jgi:hypothetical protein
MEASARDPVLDRIRAQAQAQQLPTRDDAMLPLGKRPNPLR